MGIVFQKDKRSGITYAYENFSYWVKEKQQSRSKRKLIGRVTESGEIVPTDGRCRKDAIQPKKLAKEVRFPLRKSSVLFTVQPGFWTR